MPPAPKQKDKRQHRSVRFDLDKTFATSVSISSSNSCTTKKTCGDFYTKDDYKAFKQRDCALHSMLDSSTITWVRLTSGESRFPPAIFVDSDLRGLECQVDFNRHAHKLATIRQVVKDQRLPEASDLLKEKISFVYELNSTWAKAIAIEQGRRDRDAVAEIVPSNLFK